MTNLEKYYNMKPDSEFADKVFKLLESDDTYAVVIGVAGLIMLPEAHVGFGITPIHEEDPISFQDMRKDKYPCPVFALYKKDIDWLKSEAKF